MMLADKCPSQLCTPHHSLSIQVHNLFTFKAIRCEDEPFELFVIIASNICIETKNLQQLSITCVRRVNE